MKERDQLEEPGIGSSIILKWVDLTEIGVELLDWFSLAQDRGKWRGCCECGDKPFGSTKRTDRWVLGAPLRTVGAANQHAAAPPHTDGSQ